MCGGCPSRTGAVGTALCNTTVLSELQVRAASPVARSRSATQIVSVVNGATSRSDHRYICQGEAGVGIEGPAVHGEDAHGYAGERRRDPAEDPGLGAVCVHDHRPFPSQ